MRRPVLLAGVFGLAGLAASETGCRAESRWIEPRTGMEFVAIPAGTFMMGSPPGEADREPQERQHAVTLTRAFILGRYEVTQGQWRRLMGSNPSRFADRGDNFPVENVNYEDIREFLQRLNEGQGSEVFRLPTEAEWEYACRAGATTAFAGGETLSLEQANYLPAPGAAERGTTYVGFFASNAWGLHDMHGNVWEWTSADYCPYPDGAVKDPQPRCESGLKVIRGGSWYFGADSARCALRYTHPPKELGQSLGFRVAADSR